VVAIPFNPFLAYRGEQQNTNRQQAALANISLPITEQHKMANATNQTNYQVIRTPGWVVYGEYATPAEAQAAADAAQKTDEGGNVFVHIPEYEDEYGLEHGICDGPFWHDGCQHDPQEYVCSFEHPTNEGTMEKFDLYVFDQPRSGQSVCMRYGNEGYEYISPGSVADFLRRSRGSEVYQRACSILLLVGAVKWKHKAREDAMSVGRGATVYLVLESPSHQTVGVYADRETAEKEASRMEAEHPFGEYYTVYAHAVVPSPK